MRKKLTAAIFASLAGLATLHAARADVQLERRGAVVYLHSTRLLPGDAETFQQFLSSPDGQGARIVYLDSNGGHPPTAMAIARMIRQRGLDTAYHVGRGRCVSACTNVFLGGVHRYYIGGGEVADGVATQVGLGFHPSNGGPAMENQVMAHFRSMGVPGAAELRYHLYPRAEVLGEPGGPGRYQLFFVSGQRALRTRVATSLTEPANPALQDGQ